MSSPSLDSDDSDYIPKPKFQIDLYAGDTIIVEHDLFPGTWSCHRLIYGIDARENKVDLNIPLPLTSAAKIQLVETRRKNVNADHFRRIIPITSCILHSGSIDGMDTSQRTLNRIKNSQDRATDVVTGAIRYAMQQEDGSRKNQTTTTGGQTQTRQELVSRRLFTSTKRENTVATVDRDQQVIERIRGGGGNDETSPATDQQEAVVAGPAAVYAIGTKIIKPFDGNPYKGAVISYDSKYKLYKVRYEDEDEEELDSSEVKRYLVEEPINNNTESVGISTSTTKTSKDDKKALYDWIVNASIGNII